MNVAFLLKQYFHGAEDVSIDVIAKQTMCDVYYQVRSSIENYHIKWGNVYEVMSLRLYEIFDAPFIHPTNRPAVVITHFDVEKKILRILVADEGIEINRSLAKYLGYMSMGKRTIETSLNSNGINDYTRSSILNAIGINLAIHSGHNKQIYKNRSTEIIETDFWKGTIVYIEIETSRNMPLELLTDLTARFEIYDEDGNPDFTASDIYEIGSTSFIMPFNQILRYNLFDDFPYKNNIKEFVIDRDFDYDDDCGSHFHNLPYLEKFSVIQPSPFSVEDGILYIENCDEMDGSNMLFDFLEKPQGRVLVAFPPNHPAKKFDIPSDVVAICNSAFAYSKLEELTIPDSVEQINFAVFANMENLKILRVPNKMIKMYLDHYDYEPTDFELYSNNEKVFLDDEVVRFWNEVRNREPHFDRSHYVDNLSFGEKGHRYMYKDDIETEGGFIDSAF